MMPLVYVIIANYNNIDDLIMAIDCFKEQVYQNIKIVVVDDGSDAEIVDKIKIIDGVNLIQSKTNEGWAAANNKGVKFAIDKGAEFVILANNDIYFDDERLVIKLLNNFKQFGNKSKIKILGPQNNFFKEKNRVINQGIILFTNRQGISRLNKYRIDYMKDHPISEPFTYVDAVHGCFMMVKTDLFDKIGFFDERFFMYYDEVDFCYRAWESGYSSLVNKSLKIYHKVSTTVSEKSPEQVYYLTRNLIAFVKMRLKGIERRYKNRLTWRIFVTIANVVFRKNRRKYKGKRNVLLKAILRGIADGQRKKLGKTEL